MLLAKMRKIDEQENQLTPRSDVMKATTSTYKAAASQSNIQHTALRSNSKSPHNEVVSDILFKIITLKTYYIFV